MICSIIDYQQAQFRKYTRLVKEIKPDMSEYEQSVQVSAISNSSIYAFAMIIGGA